MMKRLYTLSILILLSLVSFAQKNITLEDIWQKYTFRPESISEIRSLSDGEHYCILTRNGIEKYEYKTGKKIGYLVDFSALNLKEGTVIADYSVSNDNQKVLLAANPEYIYRHSFVAEYYLYDMKDKSIIRLTDKKIRLAEFSPTNDKIAYVFDNNLYCLLLNTMESIQITKDGKYNHIINGTTDWVYEEEFAITKGFFWNKTGDKIAYYRFDESDVKEYDMTMFPQDSLYPVHYKYKYPKAGEDNSKVDIYVCDLNTVKCERINITDDYDVYYPRMQWAETDGELCITFLNRHQNYYKLYLVNVNTKEKRVIFEDVDECYIEQPDFVTFLKDKKNVIVRSERNGYMNLYMVDIQSGKVSAITSGNYDIDNICYIDEKNKQVYFTAAMTKSYNRELLRVGFNGKKLELISDKNRQGIYTAEFSENGKYYISSFSDASTPTIYTINDNKGKVLVTLKDNAGLKNTLSQFNINDKEFSCFTNDNGDTLYYWIIKPTNMQKGKKYPVLFYVYGGPGSQEVLNSQARFFDYMWFRMLSERGYVIACVDGRGTGFRGAKFKKCTYLNLGKIEVEDQIAAAKYFGSLDFVDKDRIGIFGWSYGGYMSSLCITKGADYFKTAIAVAPVTNWRSYDNVYTERFMRTPQENAAGYDNNCPIHYAGLLKGHYLLIHGTADDNVHYQNTMNWTTELIKKNKQFLQFSYPDKNHSIYGGNTRYHLYTMMTDFLEKNL
ncbi:MAG: S9 family peptidase [Bacteroidales bacterium]|nr:S9 family peptidase [Bacteroidales bacterium]